MKQKLLILAVALMVAALSVSCAEDPVPTGPQPITITINNNQIVYAPGATTPGTGAGQAGKVTAVSIGKYGEEGCANASGSPGTVRVGCTAKLTCTPKCGSRDCSPDEHGSAPTFFSAVANSGNVQLIPDAQNAFNLDARALAPGTPRFRCDVLGVSSQERELQVIP